MTLRDELLAANGGSKLAAACALAAGLMDGDAADLKAGYSRPDAVAAAAAFFDLDPEVVDSAFVDLGPARREDRARPPTAPRTASDA